VGDALAARSGRTWTEVMIRTHGDDTTRPLSQPAFPGMFVSALRDALIAGEVDVIVHSYKDLPSAPAAGIALGAVPVREDPRDALVSRGNLRLEDLSPGAVVGTSSPRRAAVIALLRPDLVLAPIRGNVDTRVAKVRDGEFDATILAVAGLRRIGREAEIAQIFDTDHMAPAPAQGALAVECRADDHDMCALLGAIDDPDTRLVTAAERQVLVGINAGCTSAVAAFGRFESGTLILRAEMFNEHGLVHATTIRTVETSEEDVSKARTLGLRAAADLLGSAHTSPVLLVRSEGNEYDASSLVSRGIGAVCDPYVRISPLPGDHLLEDLRKASGGWLVISSPMTMPSWVATVGAEAISDALVGLRVAATGRTSAQTLRALGCEDVLIPDIESARGLVDAMSGLTPQSVIFPCGNLALRTIPDGLRALGWTVTEGVVYETTTVSHVPASVELIRQRDVAAIVLRSPSAARALVSFITPDVSIPVVCAGSTTANAAKELGLKVTAVSSTMAPDDVSRAVAHVLKGPKQ
jgi:hydroxymethylbilane synthase